MPCILTGVVWNGSYTKGQKLRDLLNRAILYQAEIVSLELVPQHGWAQVWEADPQMKQSFFPVSVRFFADIDDIVALYYTAWLLVPSV